MRAVPPEVLRSARLVPYVKRAIRDAAASRGHQQADQTCIADFLRERRKSGQLGRNLVSDPKTIGGVVQKEDSTGALVGSASSSLSDEIKSSSDSESIVSKSHPLVSNSHEIGKLQNNLGCKKDTEPYNVEVKTNLEPNIVATEIIPTTSSARAVYNQPSIDASQPVFGPNQGTQGKEAMVRRIDSLFYSSSSESVDFPEIEGQFCSAGIIDITNPNVKDEFSNPRRTKNDGLENVYFVNADDQGLNTKIGNHGIIEAARAPGLNPVRMDMGLDSDSSDSIDTDSIELTSASVKVSDFDSTSLPTVSSDSNLQLSSSDNENNDKLKYFY